MRDSALTLPVGAASMSAGTPINPMTVADETIRKTDQVTLKSSRCDTTVAGFLGGEVKTASGGLSLETPLVGLATVFGVRHLKPK